MVAMASSRRPSSARFGRILLPWERRDGIVGTLQRMGPKRIVFGLVLLVVLVVIQRHEAELAAVRATRGTITTAREAVTYYRADKAFECPPSWNEVVAKGLLARTPKDAWGNPLRLVCPGRKDPAGFDVISDGPDGIFSGTDRVE